MSTTKTSAQVPKLRFPGFEGEWEQKALGEVAKIQRGRFSPRPRNNPIYYGGNIPFVQTSDVVTSKGRIRNYTQTLNEKGLAVSKLFPEGTILITIAANIGFTGVLEIPMACPDSLVGISCHKDHSNDFINYLLQREQPKMDYGAVEAAQKNINIAFLEPYPLVVPATKSEQQKIAAFLTAVDGRIEQLSRKKALLEATKKGVMQQLFTQTLRFQDDHGHDFPDWEEKTLGDFFTFKNGYNAEKDQYGKGTKFINVLDVLSSKPITHDSILGRVDIPEKEFAKFEVTYGDILFQRSSETREEVGQANVYLDREHSAVFGGFVIRGKPIREFDPLFMNYLLRTPIARNEITSKSGGSTRYNVSQDTLAEARIVLPPSLPEQTKIAGFLSALDGKIGAVGEQMRQTQTWKKGLLQQMFV